MLRANKVQLVEKVTLEMLDHLVNQAVRVLQDLLGHLDIQVKME